MDIRLYQLLDDEEYYRQELIFKQQEYEEFVKDKDDYLTKIAQPWMFMRWEMVEVKYNIKKIREMSRVIAELCVVKNLPAGDPCWMTSMISSYIEIPYVDIDEIN